MRERGRGRVLHVFAYKGEGYVISPLLGCLNVKQGSGSQRVAAFCSLTTNGVSYGVTGPGCYTTRTNIQCCTLYPFTSTRFGMAIYTCTCTHVHVPGKYMYTCTCTCTCV